MVELLLSFNAKVNATTLIGWTPLHDASAEGQAECATILIDRGGTVDAENDDGNTPLCVRAGQCSTPAGCFTKDAVQCGCSACCAHPCLNLTDAVLLPVALSIPSLSVSLSPSPPSPTHTPPPALQARGCKGRERDRGASAHG